MRGVRKQMRYVLTLIQLMVLTGCVAAAERDRYVVTFAPTDDGRVQVFSIPRSEVKELPAWSPGTEDPPLSIGKAVAAAKHWLKRFGDGSDDLPLADVHIGRKRAIGTESAGMKDVWFYHLLFSNSPTRQTDVVISKYVVVLMDGRILSSEVMTEREFEDLLHHR